MSRSQQALHQPTRENEMLQDRYQVAITSYDQTLAQTYELGEPLEKYIAGPPRGNTLLRWLGSSVLFLLGLIFTDTTIYLWFNPQLAGFSGDPGSICGGIVFSLIGPLLLMTSLPYSPLFWPHIATRNVICTDGFLRVRPLALKSRYLVIHWRQVSEYYTDGTRIRLIIQDQEDGGKSRSVSVLLVGSYYSSRPGTLGLATMLTRWQLCKMGKSLTDKITKLLLPQTLQRFSQGEPLTFGPFTASLSGLEYKAQSFLWEKIGSCILPEGPRKLRFLLRARNGRQLVEHDCIQIPNVFVLRALLDSELEKVREKRKGHPPENV